MAGLTQIKQRLAPCARPMVDNQELMTMGQNKVEPEATHAPTNAYKNNAYTW